LALAPLQSGETVEKTTAPLRATGLSAEQTQKAQKAANVEARLGFSPLQITVPRLAVTGKTAGVLIVHRDPAFAPVAIETVKLTAAGTIIESPAARSPLTAETKNSFSFTLVTPKLTASGKTEIGGKTDQR